MFDANGPVKIVCAHMDLASPIGTVAAISTTAAFLPQIWKIKRQGGEDLPTRCCSSIYSGSFSG